MLTSYDHTPSDALIEQHYEALQDAAVGLWRARVALKSPAFPQLLSDAVHRVLTGIREVISDELKALDLPPPGASPPQLHARLEGAEVEGEMMWKVCFYTPAGGFIASTVPKRRREDAVFLSHILGIKDVAII